MKTYIPAQNDNTRITGLSINRFGRITQLRVKIDHPKTEQVKILLSNPNPINPMADKLSQVHL
jgi:hypothetical protein